MSWSIEEAELVGEVYDRHMAVHFSEYETLDELASEWPDGYYVWRTHERLEPLVNMFDRLWLILRMFQIDSLPLHGPNGAFVSRAEWLRVTHELLLVRLAAIRDLSALLVDAVYELNIPVYQVSTSRLLRANELRGQTALRSLLERLAAAAPDLREERNLLIHHGVRRAFGDYQLFDTVAHMEAIGSSVVVEPRRVEDGTLHPFDLATEHARIAQELEQEFVATAGELQGMVMELLALLHPEWLRRFNEKRRSMIRATATLSNQ